MERVYYSAIYDRAFWIYLLVAFFFVIIGLTFLLSTTLPYILPLAILWLLANVTLLLSAYYAATDSLVIPTLFILLLIIATLWTGELDNDNGAPIRNGCGILLLLGGLVLYQIGTTTPLLLTTTYLLSWLILTLYTILAIPS